MLLLIRHENYNSALALRRVLFETCLRGTWLARCATNQIIENGRKNNFKIDFPRRKDLQKAVAENVKATGLELEAIFYNRGSGFVHGGVYETAMYAMRTNRKVSEHLFRTVRLQLRNSTVRVLQICLDFDVHLLQSAVAGQRHGNSQVEELTSRTTLLQTIAQQYRSDLRTLSGTRA